MTRARPVDSHCESAGHGQGCRGSKSYALTTGKGPPSPGIPSRAPHVSPNPNPDQGGQTNMHPLELDHRLGAHSAKPNPACHICDPSVTPVAAPALPPFVPGPGTAPSLPSGTTDFTYGPDRHQTISLDHWPEGIRVTAWVTSASDPEHMEPLNDHSFESFFPTDALIASAEECVLCGKKVVWVEEGFGGPHDHLLTIDDLPRVNTTCDEDPTFGHSTVAV